MSNHQNNFIKYIQIVNGSRITFLQQTKFFIYFFCCLRYTDIQENFSSKDKNKLSTFMFHYQTKELCVYNHCPCPLLLPFIIKKRLLHKIRTFELRKISEFIFIFIILIESLCKCADVYINVQICRFGCSCKSVVSGV